MHISRISGYNSYHAAKKLVQLKHATSRVKTACLQKCPNVSSKKTLSGVVFLAESLTLPLQAPNTSRILPHIYENTAHVIEMKSMPEKAVEVIENNSGFKAIQDMVNCVLPQNSKDFINGIIETAENVKCTPEDLAALLYKESKFKPSARNGSFIGLGQMNKKSLKLSVDYAKKNKDFAGGINHKITPEIFARLTREQQLPYVRNYILAMKKAYIKDMSKEITGGELYGLFYTPGRINNQYLTAANDPATAAFYRSNEHLDFNKDKKITKSDLQQVLDSIKSTVFKR